MPWLSTPDVRPDPAHVKRPALFLHVGNVHVSGDERGNVLFNAQGSISRAAMRDLIAVFEEWDAE